MPRLVALIPANGLPLPGIRPGAFQTFYIGEGTLKHWRVSVRGPSVLIEAPPGWQLGDKLGTGERAVFEVPRAQCYLAWALEDGDDQTKLVNWSAPVAKDDGEAEGPPVAKVAEVRGKAKAESARKEPA